jgi:hypothetical protein
MVNQFRVEFFKKAIHNSRNFSTIVEKNLQTTNFLNQKTKSIDSVNQRKRIISQKVRNKTWFSFHGESISEDQRKIKPGLEI